jgi:hypothetical protein
MALTGTEKQDRFVKALAAFLVNRQAVKSVQVELGGADALEWAAIRNALPSLGWATTEEAEAILRKFLWGVGRGA